MQIVIVGDGKMGLALTQMLSEEGHDITIVDSNAKVLARTQDDFEALAVHGHGASREVLLDAQADTARLLIAATSSDEVNLLSCLTAKKLGCQTTIARVRGIEYAESIRFLQQDLGLSLAFNPEESCAREIHHLLQFPSFLGREQFAKGRVEIVRIKISADSPLNGIPLFKLYQTAKVRVLVCAVDREGAVSIPHGNFIIQENDNLFITARGENLSALIKNLKLESLKVTQVTLVGGSRTSLYLAKRLHRSGVGVKIIEKEHSRCLYLAETLADEIDIVEADGTEHDILLSEGVARADALVALTGIDEENIVLSLYASQLGVKKVITKCNRDQYAQIFRKIGLDTVVSPIFSSAIEIVRYVRAMDNSAGGGIVAMHPIADGRAEALEFLAGEHSKALNISLADLTLKEGILIACISRGHITTIPTGEDRIKKGDSVVVVTAGHSLMELDDILA